MPAVGASRVHLYQMAQTTLFNQVFHHMMRRRRPANIAQAHHQHPKLTFSIVMHIKFLHHHKDNEFPQPPPKNPSKKSIHKITYTA